ncbi:hypothetical protein A6U98_01390 [Rhizobium sp. WYCCWR10014]|nr:hypothetical protein A6U98_01390 [Rhizobium sp. WYCCWR10014]
MLLIDHKPMVLQFGPKVIHRIKARDQRNIPFKSVANRTRHARKSIRGRLQFQAITLGARISITRAI